LKASVEWSKERTIFEGGLLNAVSHDGELISIGTGIAALRFLAAIDTVIGARS
jgi:hypothetical protein